MPHSGDLSLRYGGLNFKCPTSLRTAACQRYPEEYLTDHLKFNPLYTQETSKCYFYAFAFSGYKAFKSSQ